MGGSQPGIDALILPQGQRGGVVSGEHQDHRLVRPGEVVHQPAQHPVGVVQAAGEAGDPLQLPPGQQGAGHLHPLRVVPAGAVGLVVLHGHGVEKEGL